MSVNRVCITGNLTRDPELRQTAGGTPVLQMGVAVNDRQKNPQTQQWEDRANFVDCTVFGARAQGVAPHLRKGSKVAIEGRLRWSQWDDRQTGQRRSKLEVVVDEVEFMDPRPAQAAPAPAQAQPGLQGAAGGDWGTYQGAQRMAAAVQQAQPVYADESIPF